MQSRWLDCVPAEPCLAAPRPACAALEKQHAVQRLPLAQTGPECPFLWQAESTFWPSEPLQAATHADGSSASSASESGQKTFHTWLAIQHTLECSCKFCNAGGRNCPNFQLPVSEIIVISGVTM